jgi:hypothetical protein
LVEGLSNGGGSSTDFVVRRISAVERGFRPGEARESLKPPERLEGSGRVKQARERGQGKAGKSG